MLCSFLLFTDQLRMQTLHCDTLLMTETADVLFFLLISLGRVPLIKEGYLKPCWSQLDVKLGLYQLNFSNVRHRKKGNLKFTEEGFNLS